MIETSLAIPLIMFAMGMIIAAATDKNEGFRGFVLFIGILIVIFGTSWFWTSINKGVYLGKPATIESLTLNKDFVIYSAPEKNLFKIQNPDTGEIIITENLPIKNPEIGKTYFVALIKGKRIVLELKKFSTPDTQKPESTMGTGPFEH